MASQSYDSRDSTGISILPFGVPGSLTNTTSGNTGGTDQGSDECKSQGMAMDRILAAGVCGGVTYFILKKMKVEEAQKWLGTATVSAGCWILLTHLFEKKRQNTYFSLKFMALRKMAYYNFSMLRRNFWIMTNVVP